MDSGVTVQQSRITKIPNAAENLKRKVSNQKLKHIKRKDQTITIS